MRLLLEVEDLSVDYALKTGLTRALNGITFELHQGEVVGVLGASGAGKTTLALSILGLLPPGAVVRGSIRFRSRSLLDLTQKEFEQVRGSEIAMIFQEADLALNPFLRTIDHVKEVIRAHRPWSARRCGEEARAVLAKVRLCTNERLLWAYPHQLSGGERQRLVIAQALACQPALLIADEPTASLDPILQCEWAELLKELRDGLGLTVLLISHDPYMLAKLADRVLVFHGGELVESGLVEQVVRHPVHPYTRAVFSSLPPPPGSSGASKRLQVVSLPSATQILT